MSPSPARLRCGIVLLSSLLSFGFLGLLVATVFDQLPGSRAPSPSPPAIHSLPPAASPPLSSSVDSAMTSKPGRASRRGSKAAMKAIKGTSKHLGGHMGGHTGSHKSGKGKDPMAALNRARLTAQYEDDGHVPSPRRRGVGATGQQRVRLDNGHVRRGRNATHVRRSAFPRKSTIRPKPPIQGLQ